MTKELNRDQVIELIRKLVAEKGSNAAVAREMNITSAYLGEVLNGTRDPGPKILEHLGLDRKLVYFKK